jgi:hypothetical protein
MPRLREISSRWRDGTDAGQPRPHGAEIRVLHVRLADDLVASGLGDDA